MSWIMDRLEGDGLMKGSRRRMEEEEDIKRERNVMNLYLNCTIKGRRSRWGLNIGMKWTWRRRRRECGEWEEEGSNCLCKFEYISDKCKLQTLLFRVNNYRPVAAATTNTSPGRYCRGVNKGRIKLDTMPKLNGELF